MGGRSAQHLREDALGVVVGKNLILFGQFGDARRLPPVAAERPLDEAFLSDRTDAAFSAVAEPRRADDADVLRRLRGLIAFSKGFNELRGFKDAAAGAEDAEGGFIGNVLDSFFGRENGNSAVDTLRACKRHGGCLRSDRAWRKQRGKGT